MNARDDSDLVREFVRTRDPALFRELVERYERRVFRLVVSVLGPYSEAEAEDVAQEAFLRAYQQIHRFRGDSRFGSWLYRIAYNRALDRRQLARFRLPHVNDEVLAGQPAEAGDPFEAAVGREREEQVARSLESLPDLYRTVIYLYYWQQMPVEEVGEVLGLPAGTVKSYLARARQKLERELTR